MVTELPFNRPTSLDVVVYVHRITHAVSVCLHNPPTSDMDYMIFNVITWSINACVYSRGRCSAIASQHIIFDSESRRFSCAQACSESCTFGSPVRSNPPPRVGVWTSSETCDVKTDYCSRKWTQQPDTITYLKTRQSVLYNASVKKWITIIRNIVQVVCGLARTIFYACFFPVKPTYCKRTWWSGRRGVT